MKRLSRRHSLLLLSAVATTSVPFPGRAQSSLPDKSLRILVGFAAGGGSELLARMIAPQLERRLGRRVTIQNKPSGGDVTAGEMFRRELEQGLVVAFMPSTTLPYDGKGSPFPFDSRSRLVPLTSAGTFQVALAVPAATGAKTFADYADWVKARPVERARLGISSTDTYLRVYALMIAQAIGVRFEIVPHDGTAPLVKALAGGDVPAGAASVTTLLQHNFKGEVRFLMTSGARQASILKGVPTATEVGQPDLTLQDWYGFFASSSAPPAMVMEWNRQLEGVLGTGDVVAALAQLGCDVETCSPAEAATRLAANVQAWTQRAAAVGFKAGD